MMIGRLFSVERSEIPCFCTAQRIAVSSVWNLAVASASSFAAAVLSLSSCASFWY